MVAISELDVDRLVEGNLQRALRVMCRADERVGDFVASEDAGERPNLLLVRDTLLRISTQEQLRTIAPQIYNATRTPSRRAIAIVPLVARDWRSLRKARQVVEDDGIVEEHKPFVRWSCDVYQQTFGHQGAGFPSVAFSQLTFPEDVRDTTPHWELIQERISLAFMTLAII